MLSLLIAILLATQSMVPGWLGSGLATLLPWLGVVIVLLFALSLRGRRRKAWIVVLVPASVWAVIFVPTLVPLDWISPPVNPETSLIVASQNVEDGSGTAAESARGLVDRGAQIIALEELSAEARDDASAVLNPTHPYSYTVGTVGLWSKYPLQNKSPLELGLGWKRALNADVETPGGVVSVYVIHADSFRPGSQDGRDTMLEELGKIVPNDTSDRIIVMGDFNASSRDPALAPITQTLSEPNQSGLSFGFTWHDLVPFTRIDHIFERGLEATANITFRLASSDHRAILARFNV